MRWVLGAGLTALVVAGCANQRAQQEADEVRNVCSATKARFNPVLGAHMSMGNIVDTTPSMLADDTVPTPEQVRAINDMEAALGPCRAQMMAFAYRYTPSSAQAGQGYILQNRLVMADLIGRKITFGEANRRSLGLYLETQGQIQQANAADQDRRMRAWAIYQQAMQANRGVSCTTTAFGQTATTNCR